MVLEHIFHDTFQKTRIEWNAANPLEKAALIALLCSCIGVVYFIRLYSKIKLGPVFILDFTFLICFAAFISKRPWKIFSIPFYLVSAFFVLGAAFLFRDIAIARSTSIGLFRIVQHSITFVYPFLWFLIGSWVGSRFLNSTKTLALAMLAASIPSYLFNVYGDYVGDQSLIGANLAVGPLLVVFAAYLTSVKAPKIASALVSILAFVPFWIMFHSYMQRISLIEALLATLLFPILYHRGEIKKAAVTLLTLIFIFSAGTFVSSKISAKSEGIVGSLRHGDDREHIEKFDPNAKVPIFQGRSRMFWWKNAIELWKTNPMFGVGFIPEVPTYYKEGVPNDGNFPKNDEYVSLAGKPIAGPHNSYLNLLARTGFIGTSIFMMFVFSLLWTMASTIPATFRKENLADQLLFFVVLNGLLYAGIGLGFESPHNSMLLWLSAGILVSRKAYK